MPEAATSLPEVPLPFNFPGLSRRLAFFLLLQLQCRLLLLLPQLLITVYSVGVFRHDIVVFGYLLIFALLKPLFLFSPQSFSPVLIALRNSGIYPLQASAFSVFFGLPLSLK